MKGHVLQVFSNHSVSYRSTIPEQFHECKDIGIKLLFEHFHGDWGDGQVILISGH